MIKIGKKLKARLEKPYMKRFWGMRRKVKPVFIEEALGDGKQLIALTPINTRAQYYLIRVDSSWSTTNEEGKVSLGEHLEEIYVAIENQCGRRYEDKYESPSGRPRYNPWPALDEHGCSWNNADDLLKGKKS